MRNAECLGIRADAAPAKAPVGTPGGIVLVLGEWFFPAVMNFPCQYLPDSDPDRPDRRPDRLRFLFQLPGTAPLQIEDDDEYENDLVAPTHALFFER